MFCARSFKFLKCIFSSTLRVPLISLFVLSNQRQITTAHSSAFNGNSCIWHQSRSVDSSRSIRWVINEGCIAAYTIRCSPCTTVLFASVQSSLDVISVFHRGQIGLSCGLFPDIVITASTIAPWRFECRGVLEGTLAEHVVDANWSYS